LSVVPSQEGSFRHGAQQQFHQKSVVLLGAIARGMALAE
jgi:hypothetical protein